MQRSYLTSASARLTIVSLLIGLGLGVHVACSPSSDSNADCEEGAEGCSCYPNNSCDSGLECHSGLCVEEDVDGAGGSSGGSGGSTGGSGGSTGGSGGSTGGSGGSTGGSDDSTSTSDAGGSNSGGGGNCEDGAEGCSCYPNDTCDADLACASGVCVDAAGSGGTAGAGTGGASTSSGGSGGSPTTDSGGTGGTGGANSGTGGAATNGTGGTGGGGEVTDPAIIDNFSSCDGVISSVDGRDGYWFTFGDEDVNVLPTTDVGAQGAPSSFEDTSCAAWYTTDCSETATYCEFAGLGFVFFADEAPYDLSAYQALQVQREGDAQWIVVHMSGGLTFGASLPAGIGTDSVYFYSFTPSGDTDIYAVPDWSQVTKIEFTAFTPEASGLAVYDVRLY